MKDTSSNIKSQRSTKPQKLQQRTIKQKASEIVGNTEVSPYTSSEYRTLFDLSPMGFIVINMKGVITNCNPAFYQLTGYSSGDFMGKHFSRIPAIRAKDIPKFIKMFNSLIGGKIPKPFEVTYTHKDGSIRYAEICFNLIKSDKKTTGIMVVQNDITEKKKISNELKQNIDKYQTLIENLQQGIWAIDKQANTTYVNQPMADMLGYSPEEMLGKHLFSFMDKRGIEIATKLLNNRRHGIKEQHEFEFLRKDGSRIYTLLNTSPILDDRGNYTGAIAGVQDITVLKLAEQQYSTIIQTAMDGFLISDLQGNLFDANKAYCKLVGYSREELLNMNITDIEANETPEETARHLQQIYNYGSVRFETKHRRKDGRIIDVVVSSNYVDIATGRLFAFFHDITEHKKLEETLSKERQEMIHVIDSSPINIFFKDLEGKFILVNRTFAEALNMPKEEFTGKTVFDLYPTELAQGMTDDDQVVFNTGQPKLGIIEKYVSASGIRWIQTDKVPIFDKNGTITGLVGFAQDITERQQAEQKYRNLFEQSIYPVYISSITGNFENINQAMLDLFGYSKEEMLRMHVRDIYFNPTDRDKFQEIITKNLFVKDYSVKLHKKNGEVMDCLVTATIRLSDNKTIAGYQGIIRDITDRIQAERQKELSLKIMDLLNKSGEQLELIRDIILLIRKSGGFEAVGVRLKQGNDYPYYQYDGFTNSHIKLENSLCAVDKDGRIITDSNGNPVLECMCGNIINGRFDPSKPFFTEGGSFWINCTTELLASTTEKDRQARTRNTCNGEGYESVALIPLKGENGNIGLLQLNDSRRNCFNLELIKYYEGIAQSIGIVLSRQRAREQLEDSYHRLQRAIEGAVRSIALTTEMKDPYTAGHQQRVAILARAIAEEIKLTSEQIETIGYAAILHDIGKIKIPSEILSKPGRLNNYEMDLIKTHPQIGHEIVKTLELPWNICPIVLKHHERLDGSGYPQGLKGEDIPIEARIMAVADVVEAMASHRPYRPSLGIDTALEEISNNKDTLYDSLVVDACITLFKEKGFTFENRQKPKNKH
jgi:PAS domain S-box-containing protein/putative nucleotidyltransferase with HDIG domain